MKKLFNKCQPKHQTKPHFFLATSNVLHTLVGLTDMMAFVHRAKAALATTAQVVAVLVALFVGIVLASACDHLRDQPSPAAQAPPVLEALTILLTDSGDGQVALPSALSLNTGPLTLTHSAAKYGTITLDVARQHVHYTAGPAFTTGDTATYTVARNGLFSSATIFIGPGTLCRPVARLDTFYFEQPVVGLQPLNIQGNDAATCPNLRLELLLEPNRSSRFRLQGGQVYFHTDTQFAGTDSIKYRICNRRGFCSDAIIRVRVAKKRPPICTIAFQAPIDVIYFRPDVNNPDVYLFRKPLREILRRATFCPDDSLDLRSFTSVQGYRYWADTRFTATIDTLNWAIVGTIPRRQGPPPPELHVIYKVFNKTHTKSSTALLLLRPQ